MKKDLIHYYICFDCATEKGGKWPKGHCATMHQDKCPYCNKVETLCATSDFDWPDWKPKWEERD